MLLSPDKPLLMLMDGHAMVHRAWFAIPNPLTIRKTGEEVRGVYGFAQMVRKAVADYRPTHVVLTFDSPGPTFRHLEFEAYKANRPAMPDDLHRQFGHVRRLDIIVLLGVAQLGDRPLFANGSATMSSGKTHTLIIGENNTLEGVVKEISGGRCTVQLDGGEVIDAVPVNVSKVGERTRVSIRPERVEVNPDLGEEAHTLKAKVKEFIYMGDIFRTRLSVAGNEDFVIKTRNRPDQVRLKPGDEVTIGWMPEDCRALDAQ